MELETATPSPEQILDAIAYATVTIKESSIRNWFYHVGFLGSDDPMSVMRRLLLSETLHSDYHKECIEAYKAWRKVRSTEN